MKKKDRKVLFWECPSCGFEISSLYPSQLEHNKREHVTACCQRVIKEKLGKIPTEKGEGK